MPSEIWKISEIWAQMSEMLTGGWPARTCGSGRLSAHGALGPLSGGDPVVMPPGDRCGERLRRESAVGGGRDQQLVRRAGDNKAKLGGALFLASVAWT